MGQTGSNFTGSVTAWSEITMKVLLQRMDVLGFGAEAGHLRSSLQKGRLQVSDKGNDIYNLIMSFNLYGRFVDMGVGREFRRGNDGRHTESRRKPKEWLFPVLVGTIPAAQRNHERKVCQCFCRSRYGRTFPNHGWGENHEGLYVRRPAV